MTRPRCTHRWRLEEQNGSPVVRGECCKCGAERPFKAAWDRDPLPSRGIRAINASARTLGGKTPLMARIEQYVLAHGPADAHAIAEALGTPPKTIAHYLRAGAGEQFVRVGREGRRLRWTHA